MLSVKPSRPSDASSVRSGARRDARARRWRLASSLLFVGAGSFACAGAPPSAPNTAAIERPRPTAVETTSRSAAPEESSEGAPTAVAAVPAPVESSSAPPASSQSATSATPSLPPNSAPEPAPLPVGTTVLHIGDSFAGALGIDLDQEFKARGVRGVLKYETATYIPTWASNKDLDQYLTSFHPDLVLITLGANELTVPDPKVRIPTIHRLVARLGGRPCVWVAPPLWKGARPVLLDTIRQSAAPCLYLDSGALVPDLPRMRDGIHPSMPARKEWAKAVIEWLQAHRVENGARPWELHE
ncbi:MAG TPA: SGNH/GDSL hydrolase family protein [Polyangiaceae bacterium]|nr:SGNH/GDSL hydrolase family protein [Polyangiaceae bacterium]